MNSVAYILDSSALLATLRGEPGALGSDVLQKSAMSAVNISETVAKLAEYGTDANEAASDIGNLGISVIDFSLEHAIATAKLRAPTRNLGLSLGDRACIALGLALGVPVLTADRVWQRLKAGPKITVIR